MTTPEQLPLSTEQRDAAEFSTSLIMSVPTLSQTGVAHLVGFGRFGEAQYRQQLACDIFLNQTGRLVQRVSFMHGLLDQQYRRHELVFDEASATYDRQVFSEVDPDGIDSDPSDSRLLESAKATGFQLGQILGSVACMDVVTPQQVTRQNGIKGLVTLLRRRN